LAERKSRRLIAELQTRTGVQAVNADKRATLVQYGL
jgi:hypothetical protein